MSEWRDLLEYQLCSYSLVSRSQCKMTCDDEYILFVVLLAAIILVKAMERHREASGCVQMLFNLFSLKFGGCCFHVCVNIVKLLKLFNYNW